MMVTVIGRGHSGTRAMSHTLSASGVFMGCPQNPSGDLLPPDAMYEACRVMARYVRWQGGLEWDFSALHTMEIPGEFRRLIESYLRVVLDSPAPHRGWKIPETTLVYPWILRLFPEIKYIFWIRDPRDCILGPHLTDNLADFGVPYPSTDDARLRRAISWQYQFNLIKATPRAAHWIEVRFEDFVLRQAETLARLERFLGLPLARIPARAEAVARWQRETKPCNFDFLATALHEYGYDVPATRPAPEVNVPC